ncbi:MAG: aspartate-alanine antiporter [Halioglobus sp.]|nr:aspartate-alanine antiporter [Halioglobus sp.]
MSYLHDLFEAAPISALFLALAAGYVLGKIRFGRFQLGGLAGTLFAAIIIGQVGVEVDENIKEMSFAIFIYTLGFVSGPQFFQSLGRSTLNQLHLTLVSSLVIFATVWTLAKLVGLDQGTAAGLLAGATTESASVGTAGDAISAMQLDEATKATLQANIAVTYAVTYLFGFTLVVFFVTNLAPRLMGIDLAESARAYDLELGNNSQTLVSGQSAAMDGIRVRIYRVDNVEMSGVCLGQFREQHDEMVHIERVVRAGQPLTLSSETTLQVGDLVRLIGQRASLVASGRLLGEEVGEADGFDIVTETRDVVITRSWVVGKTMAAARDALDINLRRGVFALRLRRGDRDYPFGRHTVLQAGDVLTLHGPAQAVSGTAHAIGYSIDGADGVDYAYLGLGIVVGMLLGMVTVPVAGSEVALHTGGGCLIAGLLFGWLRSKRPTFGNIPPATALHLRDYGLSIFIASVGLASGPQALTLLQERGLILPLLSLVVVLMPLTVCTFYARVVLKMSPALVCGALAGVMTCTPALNALVGKAGSEAPVAGYTVPYAVSNVILTLLGPIIVLTV